MYDVWNLNRTCQGPNFIKFCSLKHQSFFQLSLLVLEGIKYPIHMHHAKKRRTSNYMQSLWKWALPHRSLPKGIKTHTLTTSTARWSPNPPSIGKALLILLTPWEHRAPGLALSRFYMQSNLKCFSACFNTWNIPRAEIWNRMSETLEKASFTIQHKACNRRTPSITSMCHQHRSTFWIPCNAYKTLTTRYPMVWMFLAKAPHLAKTHWQLDLKCWDPCKGRVELRSLGSNSKDVVLSGFFGSMSSEWVHIPGSACEGKQIENQYKSTTCWSTVKISIIMY